MNVTYTLQITAICPVDALPDVYICRVRSSRTVPVEDILTAVKKVTEKPLYQEEITEKLHRILACEVETVGWHSGVKTTCVIGEN